MADKRKTVIWGDSVARGVVYDAVRGRYAIAKENAAKYVADALGISQSYISRLEKRIIKHLREEIAGKY